MILAKTWLCCCCCGVVLWCLLLGGCAAARVVAETACLPMAPGFTAGAGDSRSPSIVIQTNRRIGPRLTAEVLRILIRDELGHANVELRELDAQPNIFEFRQSWSTQQGDNAISKNDGSPKAVIDLNVPKPLEARQKPQLSSNLLEFGSASPPGRFGIFIPKYVQGAIPGSDRWQFYQNESNVEHFAVNRSQHLETIGKYAYDADLRRFTCVEEYCDRGIFTPPWCENASCALLLTSHPNYTDFIVTHVNHLKLRTVVAWLGDNLKRVIDVFTILHQPFAFLEWTPGYFTLNASSLAAVAMPSCDSFERDISDDDSDDDTNPAGCDFDTLPTYKVVSAELSRDALELVHKFALLKREYRELLAAYAAAPTFAGAACAWLRANGRARARWRPTVYAPTAVNRPELYVGGMFPADDGSIHYHGTVVAARMAEAAINADARVLGAYTLRVLSARTPCEPTAAMKVFINYVPATYFNNMLGILGPPCSETVEHLTAISSYFSTLMISYSAEGGAATYSDRAKNPFFFRTIGENGEYKHVYLALCERMRWRRVAALAEDGQKYTEYLSSMGDFLQPRGVRLIMNVKFPKGSREPTLVRHLEDLKAKSARIIIADVYDEVARIVMCQAHRLNMTSAQGYVWFLPGWLPRNWYNTTHFNKYQGEKVDCSVETMEEAIDGYFSLDHVPFGPRDLIMQEKISIGDWLGHYQLNMSSWMRSSKRISTLGVSDLTSSFAGYTYDAVWMFALAANKLFKENPDIPINFHIPEVTSKLISNMESMEFNGVSGPVKFNGGVRFSNVQITQWVRRKITLIGTFFPNVSDSRPEILGGSLVLNESLIQWFTLDGSVPHDGTESLDECALGVLADFLDMSCTATIVVTNVVFTTFLLIALLAIVIWLKRRYDKKMQFNENLMKAIGFNGNDCVPTLDAWEINRECVVLYKSVGSGAFGTVYLGEALLNDGKGWVAVAVKTLKAESNSDDKVDFLSEAQSMKRFDHKNIVKLLGVCTKSEPFYTIMDYMLYGDLRTFLITRRKIVNSEGATSDVKDEISSKRLTQMALDVARALSYLADLNFVHRDVACRNCLVSAQRVVKLGDFGMARYLYSGGEYRFSRKGKLPVRWMAPESVGLGLFTLASDVWSYAVLLYEIMTCGSYPYQGLTNGEALERIKAGRTLQVPAGVRPQLEALMRACWSYEAEARPHAAEIVEYLASNPRAVAPCLDVPLKPISAAAAEHDELEGTGQLQQQQQQQQPLQIVSSEVPVTQRQRDEAPMAVDSIALQSMRFDNPSYISSPGVEKAVNNNNSKQNGRVKHQKYCNGRVAASSCRYDGGGEGAEDNAEETAPFVS